MKRKTIILLFAALAACSILLGVAILGYQDIQVITTPGNPASGYMRVFASGSQLGCLTSSGGNCLSGAGATIPSNCALITSNGTPTLSCQTAKGLASVAYIAGGGTANAQTATYSPAIAAQADIVGYPICWLPSNANTGGATFNANGLGAQTIDKATGSGLGAIVANDLLTTAVACAIWDGTVYELQNPQTGGGGGSSPLTTKGDLYTFSSVNARLPVGSNGQCLTAQSGQTTGLLWASCTAGGGGLTQLGQSVIGTGSTGICSIGASNLTVTCSSIPGTYTSIKVSMSVESTTTNDGVYCEANSDTGSNYLNTFLISASGSNPTQGTGQSGGPTSVFCAVPAYASGSGAPLGYSDLLITGYTIAARYKQGYFTSLTNQASGAKTPENITGGWYWLNSSAAITSLLFGQKAGGAFQSGDTITIYGIL